MLLKCLVLLSLACVYCSALGSVKNIVVRGQVVCSVQEQANVEIELWEHDLFDPDDLLNKTKPDSGGQFRVFGEEAEIFNIEPYLVIVHNCENGASPRCKIRDTYDIPNEYVNRVYHMGSVDLNIAKNRRKSCV